MSNNIVIAEGRVVNKLNSLVWINPPLMLNFEFIQWKINKILSENDGKIIRIKIEILNNEENAK